MSREDFGSVPERQEKILAALREAGRPLTVKELAEQLKLSRPATGGALSGLQQRRAVMRRGRRGWEAR